MECEKLQYAAFLFKNKQQKERRELLIQKCDRNSEGTRWTEWGERRQEEEEEELGN